MSFLRHAGNIFRFLSKFDDSAYPLHTITRLHDISPGEHLVYCTDGGWLVHLYAEDVQNGQVTVVCWCDGSDGFDAEARMLMSLDPSQQVNLRLQRRVLTREDIRAGRFARKVHHRTVIEEERGRLEREVGDRTTYSLFYNNSEHFVNFVKTGERESQQFQPLLSVLARKLITHTTAEAISAAVGEAAAYEMLTSLYNYMTEAVAELGFKKALKQSGKSILIGKISIQQSTKSMAIEQIFSADGILVKQSLSEETWKVAQTGAAMTQQEGLQQITYEAMTEGSEVLSIKMIEEGSEEGLKQAVQEGGETLLKEGIKEQIAQTTGQQIWQHTCSQVRGAAIYGGVVEGAWVTLDMGKTTWKYYNGQLSSDELKRYAFRRTIQGGGSWAGGMAGTAVGSVVGGVICSVVPVVGTAAGASVGGAIGNMIGGVAGHFAGSQIARSILEQYKMFKRVTADIPP